MNKSNLLKSPPSLPSPGFVHPQPWISNFPLPFPYPHRGKRRNTVYRTLCPVLCSVYSYREHEPFIYTCSTERRVIQRFLSSCLSFGTRIPPWISSPSPPSLKSIHTSTEGDVFLSNHPRVRKLRGFLRIHLRFD